MRSGRVRFNEVVPSAGSPVDTLMEALQIDESSSVNETKMEASFMSEGNINRYNYIGRTPHAKVLEAEENRKRLKELTKLMAMPSMSQTPVRISVPISEISPQSDVSMSPALMDRSNYSSVGFSGDESHIVSVASEGRISPVSVLPSQSKNSDTSSRGIAMDNSTPMADRSQQSNPTPRSMSSNFSSDASFNIVESLGSENQVSAPAAAISTPLTINGSIAVRATKETTTPFSDISNRSAPVLNQRDDDVEFDISPQKTVANKSVSFHHAQLTNSTGKTKHAKRPPVTPYAKIECSESEDGESDADCNVIIMSQLQCSSPNVHEDTFQQSSVVEKKLFLSSSEKPKAGPGGAKSPAVNEREAVSKPSSPTESPMGIAAIPVSRKVKEESRDWHGGLELAKETMPTQMIQTQYIIVPAPRPDTQDVATMYSPMAMPASPAMNPAPTSVPVVVTFSPVHTQSIATSPMMVSPVPPNGEVIAAGAQRQAGLPPIAPVSSFATVVRPVAVTASQSHHIISQNQTQIRSHTVTNVITRQGRPLSTDSESGVSFGRGPTANSKQPRPVNAYKTTNVIVPSVDTKMMVEVEKPVVSVCTVDLHPAKAFYSPNNTRKVQNMLAESNHHHLINSHQLHEKSHLTTTADYPSEFGAANISYHHIPEHTKLVSPNKRFGAIPQHESSFAGNNLETDKEIITCESPTKAISSTMSVEEQQDLSSIRAMDVSIQVDSTMFNRKREINSSSNSVASSKNRSIVNTPGSSVQTDPMSQSVLLRSTAKSTSGGVNESIVSHSSSYYYAASGESEDTGNESEKSFTLADLLPRTALTNGFGKGLFPEENTKKYLNEIVPTSLANPWIHRFGFDARQCNVSPPFSTQAIKTSPLMSSVGSIFQRSTTSLGKPLRIVEDSNKKQKLIDQWNVSYYNDDEDESHQIENSMNRDVLFKQELEQRFAAQSQGSRGTASTVTIDRTVNPNKFYSNVMDLTMRSDIAVATYPRQHDSSAHVEDEDLSRSYLTTGADTTFTLDQSYMTKTSLLSQEEVIPRFSIKSLKRSSGEAFEVKEINFETAPGECTTVMMVFDNNRPHEVLLKAQTALVRVEPMTGGHTDQNAWDEWADQVMEDKNEEIFSVSPGEVTIPATKEGMLFVTFAPPLGMEGIYSGAMRLKHERKSYVLLLRGESASRHSVQNTPANLTKTNTAGVMSTRSQMAVPEQIEIGANTAVEVSQFYNQSQLTTSSKIAAHTANAVAVSTTALELSSVILPGVASQNHAVQKNNNTISAVFSASSIAEESIIFPSHQIESEVSPTSNAFQARLRALQERIADISRKIVWKNEVSPSREQFSPAASEASAMGLQVHPELLRVSGNLDEYQVVTLSNPHTSHAMMVQISSSHDCLRASTNILSINPDSEARILVKIARNVLLQSFGEAMHKQLASNDEMPDNWCCGALTLLYGTDLEVVVNVVLSDDVVESIVQEYLQVQSLKSVAPSIVSTPATMPQARFPETSSTFKRQQLMVLNGSDYHHQLQNDENSEVNVLPSADKSMKSINKSSMSKSHTASAVYQKPPLQPNSLAHFQHQNNHKMVTSDAVSVASTISSHTHHTQLSKGKRMVQNSIVSSSSSVASSTAVVKTVTKVVATSMMSAPDLSLTSNVSTVAGHKSKKASSDRMHISSGSRRGLYFENPTAIFGSVMVGSLVRTRIILANASNHETVVYLGDPDLPFVLHKNEIRLKPRSFARVPVRFVPVSPGHFQAELLAQSANGQEIASIKLTGHAYA
jgi:hypothetical protein